ncbi:MAG TPA: hypothetical protein VK485_12130 [Sphingomicrobium sp.]|nr:hypothetical protein [Sphingomicrobium sp.]
MATQAEETRTIKVLVENEEGLPLIGARVEIFVDREPFGELSTGGESSIEIDTRLTVELRASAGRFVTSASVEPNATFQRLIIPTRMGIELAAIPTARCPDGKAGQPCVTCDVRGRRIRICA